MDDGTSSNAEFAAVDREFNRTRSDSANSGHRRSLSGSLLSRLSFLRMNQETQFETGAHSNMDQDGDSEDFGSGSMPRVSSETASSGREMSAVIQQQRRTRRRRGSLRKTALLGTRLEMREKRATAKVADSARADTTRHHSDALRSPRDPTSPPSDNANDYSAARGSGSFDDDDGDDAQPSWFRASTAQKIFRPSLTRRRQTLNQHNLLREENGTDDEEFVSFPHISAIINPSAGPGAGNNTKSTPTSSLHMPNPSSSSDSYYPLTADTAYRPVHRTKSSPLATHSVEMKSNADIAWDYSETEWWGWIILLVTWLVFVVGIGSCFEVWSWAWDVGETPYAPPELEDDPTLPIVGYYPALIILTAVMSWVWVVVAWVGMKYFKHANISGDDS